MARFYQAHLHVKKEGLQGVGLETRNPHPGGPSHVQDTHHLNLVGGSLATAPPHELFPWEYAVKRKPPPDPRHRYWMPEELFPSVVRSHRAVMRWRQPRSIHLCDEHGCVQLVDAGGETTRGRVPRGVSETFEVSPTGSIPRRENPAWQVANDKVEASRTMLPCGHEAPEEKRPLTRGTVEDSRKTNRRGSQIPQPKVHGP